MSWNVICNWINGQWSKWNENKEFSFPSHSSASQSSSANPKLFISLSFTFPNGANLKLSFIRQGEAKMTENS